MGLLNHNINQRCGDLSNRQHKCLKCGESFTHELILKNEFVKYIERECEELQNLRQTQVSRSLKRLMSSF